MRYLCSPGVKRLLLSRDAIFYDLLSDHAEPLLNLLQLNSNLLWQQRWLLSLGGGGTTTISSTFSEVYSSMLNTAALVLRYHFFQQNMPLNTKIQYAKLVLVNHRTTLIEAIVFVNVRRPLLSRKVAHNLHPETRCYLAFVHVQCLRPQRQLPLSGADGALQEALFLLKLPHHLQLGIHLIIVTNKKINKIAWNTPHWPNKKSCVSAYILVLYSLKVKVETHLCF